MTWSCHSINASVTHILARTVAFGEFEPRTAMVGKSLLWMMRAARLRLRLGTRSFQERHLHCFLLRLAERGIGRRKVRH